MGADRDSTNRQAAGRSLKGRPSRAHRAAGVLLAVLFTTLSTMPPGGVAVAQTDPEVEGGLRRLGWLSPPDWALQAGAYANTVIDPANRRLYSFPSLGSAGRAVEYDLNQAIPGLLRSSAPFPAGTHLNLSRRNSVALDDDSGQAIGNRHPRVFFMQQNSVQADPLINILDLSPDDPATPQQEGLTLSLGWNLRTMLPGFAPLGINYSSQDDRLYVVGNMTVSQAVYSPLIAAGVPVVVAASVVLAIKVETAGATDPDPSKTVAWVRPVAQCAYPMNNWVSAAFITRNKSETMPALYFACVKKDGQPGESGLVRLRITPTADQTAAASFPVEFFPISGSYFGGSSTGGDNGQLNGLADFDFVSERFFMLSVSARTPGVWVFDGKLSAWVGFAANDDNRNLGMSVNQANGHVYSMDGDLEGIRVFDGRATPLPNGRAFSGFHPRQYQQYLVDPETNRLFVVTRTDVPAGFGVGSQQDGVQVLLDETASVDPLPTGYDALTADVAENSYTRTVFAGTAGGFGVRSLLVGGCGGLESSGIAGACLGAASDQSLNPADRGFIAARVPEVDVRESGAVATAQSLILDSNTASDWQTRQPTQTARDWPWSPALCADPQAKPTDTVTAPAGESRVTCSSSNSSASASSFYGEVFSAEGVSVRSASTDVSVFRDTVTGTVTSVRAVAKGVELSVPGQGSITIGRIVNEAWTIAHGLPGSADRGWRRRLEGVILKDSSGTTQTVEACEESSLVKRNSCDQLIAAMNESLGVRMRIRLPEPELTKTPKGAFSGIRQSEGDFREGETVLNQGTSFSDENNKRPAPALEVVVFNDSAEKSRLVMQFAAVQASSIYTISCPEPNSIVGKQCLPPPGSLTIRLGDRVQDPDAWDPAYALSGGLFKVYSDTNSDGVLDPIVDMLAEIPDGGAATCVSGDGSGNCQFELSPGDYVIHQAAAPPGYATGPDYPPVEDRPFTIEPEFAYTVDFVNLRAIGSIEITLADAATKKPLQGGVFEVFADNGDEKVGDGDLLFATCSTDEEGACPLTLASQTQGPTNTVVEVPFGTYVIHQKQAPRDYLVAEQDAAVTLELPGQVAKASFTNALGIAGILIALSDDALPPKPLAGSVFETYEGGASTAGRTKLASCTTNATGICIFRSADVASPNGSLIEVIPECREEEEERCLPTELGTLDSSEGPLIIVRPGSYVVHQGTAPAGYKTAEDLALDLGPGQAAAIVFRNGVLASSGSVSVNPTPDTETVVEYEKPQASAPAPTLQAQPVYTRGGTLPEKIFRAPVDAFKFIVRYPQEAALFAGILLLFVAAASMLWRRSLLARTIASPALGSS